MKVKICGITRIEDVHACEKSNSDFIGFINIERSKRYVKLDKVNELTSSMGKKEKAVIVIEPENGEEAVKKAEKTGIKILQLHSLSNKEINRIKENKELKIIRAIGISEKINGKKENEIKQFAGTCDYLLFDYEVEGKSGGTGMQIPLDAAVYASKIAKKTNSKIELFLAGGMNADYIKEHGNLISKFFDIVDLNSGVEDSPGIKNTGKIKRILKLAGNFKTADN